MINLTILTVTEYFERKYDFLKIRDSQAAATDFSLLLGEMVSDDIYKDTPISSDDIIWKRYLHDTKSIENRTGAYWTRKTPNCVGTPHLDNGDRYNGIRPVTQYSYIKNTCKNERQTEDGITIVEWGEYPQQAVSKEMQETLEKLFNEKRLNETGKTYTTDSVPFYVYDQDFTEIKHIEYEYNNKKYIRVKLNIFCGAIGMILSNGERYNQDDIAWIEVQPIVWAIDKEKNIAITDKIIVAGIKYDDKQSTSKFEETHIYNFMNNYLLKDITPKELYLTPELTDYSIDNNGVINLNIANIPLEKIKLINLQSQDKKEEISFSRK